MRKALAGVWAGLFLVGVAGAVEPAKPASVGKVSIAAPSAEAAMDAVDAELAQARTALTTLQGVEKQAAPDAKTVKEAAVRYRVAFGRAVDQVESMRAQGADVRMAETRVTAFMKQGDETFRKVMPRVPEEAKADVREAQACHGRGRALGHQKARGQGHRKGQGQGHRKYDGKSVQDSGWGNPGSGLDSGANRNAGPNPGAGKGAGAGQGRGSGGRGGK